MEKNESLGRLARFQAWLENLIMTRLVGKDHPGPVFKAIFRIPILLYRAGLGNLVGSHFLLLTTTGRKTKKLHATPLEFQEDKEHGGYLVTAGWGGKTDWYRNARANPMVKIQIGKSVLDAQAIPLGNEEVAKQLLEITRKAPQMLGVWQRWCDKPVDGSFESLLYAAKFFPSMRLIPISNKREQK